MANYAIVILATPKTAWGEQLLSNEQEIKEYINHMLGTSWLDALHIQVTETEVQVGETLDGEIASAADVQS